jgi:hypothetical protein
VKGLAAPPIGAVIPDEDWNYRAKCGAAAPVRCTRKVSPEKPTYLPTEIIPVELPCPAYPV